MRHHFSADVERDFTALLRSVFERKIVEGHWIFGKGNEPMLVLDRRTGEPIPPLRIRDENGELMRGDQLAVMPGPGADAETLARFERERS